MRYKIVDGLELDRSTGKVYAGEAGMIGTVAHARTGGWEARWQGHKIGMGGSYHQAALGLAVFWADLTLKDAQAKQDAEARSDA